MNKTIIIGMFLLLTGVAFAAQNITVGQTIPINAVASGGIPPYQNATLWHSLTGSNYIENTTCSNYGINNANITCYTTPETAGPNYYQVRTYDSSPSGPALAVATIEINVTGVSSPTSPSSPSAPSGSGGGGANVYQWISPCDPTLTGITSTTYYSCVTYVNGQYLINQAYTGCLPAMVAGSGKPNPASCTSLVPPSNTTNTIVSNVIPTLTLNITNNTIKLKSSVNTSIILYINGTQLKKTIRSTTNVIIYNGSLLPAGTYNVTGHQNLDNLTTKTKIYTKYFLYPYLNFTGCIKNTNSSCTLTATIVTQDNVLLARLYLNGNQIGSTYTNISYKVPDSPGTYNFVFNTLGNANYTSSQLTYNYSIEAKKAVKPEIAWLWVTITVVLAVLIAISAISLSRRLSDLNG